MMRVTAFLGFAVLLVLISSCVPFAGGTPFIPGANRGPPGATGPSVDLPLGVAPALNCTPGNFPSDLVISVSSPANFTTINGGLGEYTVGAAPAAVLFTVLLCGPAGNYNLTLLPAPGFRLNGTMLLAQNGSTTKNISWNYTEPGQYVVAAFINDSTPQGESSRETWIGVWVDGPGGYHPVTVTANVSSGGVPLSVKYAAVVNDTPANGTIVWVINSPVPTAGPMLFYNQTQLNLTLSAAGTYTGDVYVVYPGAIGNPRYWLWSPAGITSSPLLYGNSSLPNVTALPQVRVQVSHSVPVVAANTTSIAFFANVTSLNGSMSPPAGTIGWSFDLNTTPNCAPWVGCVNTTLYGRTGPSVGSEVIEQFTMPGPFWPFATCYCGFQFPTAAAFVDPGGVTTGWNETVPRFGFNLTSTSVYPNTVEGPQFGNVPYWGNVTVTSNVDPLPPIAGAPNGTTNYTLVVCLGLANGSACGASDQVFRVYNWSGAAVTIPIRGLSAGAYFVGSWVYGLGASVNGFEPTVSGGGTGVNFYVSSQSGGYFGPLSLSAGGSPLNGTGPLATQLTVEAAGGAGPYNVSVCVSGPLTNATGTSSCRPSQVLTSWSGGLSSLPLLLNSSGYYRVLVTASDLVGRIANATVTFDVAAPPVASPLQVSASERESSGPPGTYAFTAAVSGGTAPYTIQWMFGDGTYGSSLPGAPAVHSYAASGSYTATVVVTDNHGVADRSSIAVLVTVPGGTSGLSAAALVATGIVVVALGVVASSAAVITFSLRFGRERRRIERWAEAHEADGPETAASRKRIGAR